MPPSASPHHLTERRWRRPRALAAGSLLHSGMSGVKTGQVRSRRPGFRALALALHESMGGFEWCQDSAIPSLVSPNINLLTIKVHFAPVISKGRAQREFLGRRRRSVESRGSKHTNNDQNDGNAIERTAGNAGNARSRFAQIIIPLRSIPALPWPTMDRPLRAPKASVIRARFLLHTHSE
jgi:hypothetical protein